MKSAGKGYINGAMERNLKENGLITKCMEEEYWFGQMESSMKENFKTIRGMDRGLLNGLMAGSMMVAG